MAEDIPEPQPQPQVEVSSEAAPPPPTPPRVAYPSLALQIWPPTQRTRDAVRSRLVENLSSPSVLTKRYGVSPSPTAAADNAGGEEASAAESDSPAS
ncbi:putative WPP domain-containing protein/3 [Dioscorea sansibarensis]